MKDICTMNCTRKDKCNKSMERCRSAEPVYVYGKCGELFKLEKR